MGDANAGETGGLLDPPGPDQLKPNQRDESLQSQVSLAIGAARIEAKTIEGGGAQSGDTCRITNLSSGFDLFR